jgi:hypothetical protein
LRNLQTKEKDALNMVQNKHQRTQKAKYLNKTAPNRHGRFQVWVKKFTSETQKGSWEQTEEAPDIETLTVPMHQTMIMKIRTFGVSNYLTLLFL